MVFSLAMSGERRSDGTLETRRLGPEDEDLALEAVRQLKDSAVRPSEARSGLRRFFAHAQNVMLVTTAGDDPVGFLLAYSLDRVDGDRPMVCLYEIGVAETHRRRGVGAALIEKLLHLSADSGATKLWAVTERDNEAATHLYERTGARPAENGEEVVYVWRLGTGGA
jgi:ribosomal protein S18 acetylase RimI-like enzyme